MKAKSGFTGGAAKVCDDYLNTDSGTGVYDEWYLPSIDELNKLYLNKTSIEGFYDEIYWSSSEDTTYLNSADTLASYVEYYCTSRKSGTQHVRAIRSF